MQVSRNLQGLLVWGAAVHVGYGGGGVVQYLHANHGDPADRLGSTTLATDAADAAIPNSRTWYKPYGEVRAGGGSLPTDRRFTGQIEDAAIGLYFYNARYYDPLLARFLSADTVAPSLANPQSFNRYSYCFGNPLKYVDSSGHTPLIVTALIGAGVGATVNLAFQVVPGIISGRDVGEAFQQVDWGQVAGAAVAGGLMGLTMGLAAPTLGSVVLFGYVGGGLSGQAAALTEAAYDEVVCYMNGSGIDGERFFQNARKSGFLSLEKMGIDSAAGAISAGAGYGLTSLLARCGFNIPAGDTG